MPAMMGNFFGSGYNPTTFASGAAGLLGGLFGDSGSPYSDAMRQYQKYFGQAANFQNPFIQAGTGAIPQYQDWLKSMQNPSQFMNQLMGQYQESPWAKFQTQQALRANTNAASAGGLIGSTPYQQAGEQYARDISSQDMGNWIQKVLGINSQYGGGLANMMGMGQNAANALTNLYGMGAGDMAQLGYGRGAGGQSDMWNMIGGAASLLGML